MSDESDLLTCPYNRSHVVSKLRMARHLVKCQANHPHVHLSTCYYDFLHRVTPEKLQEHLDSCPSRLQFQLQLSTLKLGVTSNVSSLANGSNAERERDSGNATERREHEWPADSYHASNCTETGAGRGVLSYSSVLKSQASAYEARAKPKSKVSKPKTESWDSDNSEDDS